MMKVSFSSSFLALFATTRSFLPICHAAGGGGGGEDATSLTCACAAEKSGFLIDCDDSKSSMLDALAWLQSNSCQKNCKSDICQRNYWIIQSHHDYCKETQIPELVEDGIHIYEDACDDCYIVRQSDLTLSTCPEVNCDDGSGNVAYQALIQNDCLNDCSNSKLCGENFRILRAVHDLCDEDALDQVAELGIHDFEPPCELQGCNVGSPSELQVQTICMDDMSGATIAIATTSLLGFGVIAATAIGVSMMATA